MGGKFIDAESDYNGGSNTFENIVVKQIQRCVDYLSKETVGGQVKQRSTAQGYKEDYVEDVRAKTINAIDTLRILMDPFIGEDHKKEVDGIIEDIQKRRTAIGERKTLIAGKGEVKIKDLVLVDPNSTYWKELMEYKYDKHRKLFEILVAVYKKKQSDLSKLSGE